MAVIAYLTCRKPSITDYRFLAKQVYMVPEPGSSNYREWRRDLELSLASKRKLGFVTGGVKKDETDPIKKEYWETYNSIVITWILHSVSESIKKSIMFMGNAHEMWNHLEQRFAVTDGARKYSLSKQIYETKQLGKPVSDYYTDLRVLWEELEALTVMPPITEMNNEATRGTETVPVSEWVGMLDDVFTTLRSQILHMSPLPSVEQSCNMVQ
ncbi:Zinc finger protein with KRAB and SCAN domains 8 [Bienertia sinuspersici]